MNEKYNTLYKMSRIDERLEIMGVDTSEMTAEEKFTAATGLTRYDEEMAANDWYVPAGAANTPDEVSEESEEPTGEQTGSSEPTGQTSQVEPTGEPTSEPEPTGEPTSEPEPTGEPTGDNPSTVDVETGETGQTGEQPAQDPNIYWYIGLTRPTEETIINNNLAQDANSLGWHLIGTELGTYSFNSPLNQNTTSIAMPEYEPVDYYVVLPGSLKVYNDMKQTENTFANSGSVIINGVSYTVYSTNGGEFGFKIY